MSKSLSAFLIRASLLKDYQLPPVCYWEHDVTRDIGESLWPYRTAAAAHAKKELTVLKEQSLA